MIARLVAKDLLANLRIWAGLLLVTLLAAFLGALTAGFLESGIRAGGLTALATAGISGVVIVFALVASVIVLGSVAGLTVSLQQREYALWQVVGLTPGRVRGVVFAQVLLASVVAASVGAVAAGPALAPVLGFVLDGANGFEDLDAVTSPLGTIAAVVIVVLVTVSASGRATRSASRVSITVAVHGAAASQPRLTKRRIVGSALLAAAAVALGVSQAGRSADTAEMPLLLAGVLLAAATAGLGLVIYPGLTALWAGIVPARSSVAWFLARAAATDSIRRGAATIGPLMIAIALSGLLFSLDATVVAVGGAPAPGQGLPPQVVVLLIGGPVLLSVAGATATVFMSGRERARESALLRAAGATAGVVARSAAFEALIYVMTALLSALLVIAVAVVAAAVALGTAPVFRLGECLIVAGGAALLMLAATVVPTLADLRRDIRSTLA